MDTDQVKLIDVLSQERDDEHLARSRAEDERDHLRAEVERLQALVQQMSEATTVQACRGCGQYVRPRYMADGLCARCWRALAGRQNALIRTLAASEEFCPFCTGEGGKHKSDCALADPEGQRAAAERAALVAVAKEAETEPVMSDNLRAKLAHLRAVREGKEEGGGRI